MNKKQPVRISSSSVYHLDDLIRFGGLFPPIYVNADVRRTRLLGATYAPREGGCMMVRARDDIYQNDVDVQEWAAPEVALKAALAVFMIGYRFVMAPPR